MKKTFFVDTFPNKIDFDYLENLEIEYYPAKVLYKSFFTFLNIPKIIVFSFIHLLLAKTEKKSSKKGHTYTNRGDAFFRVFDEICFTSNKK